MKKMIKRIAVLLVIALAAIGMTVFTAACGSKGETFSVTVLYPDGTPVNGLTDGTDGTEGDGTIMLTYVFVQWCDEKGCSNQVRIGEDGTASNNLEVPTDGNSYHILLTGLPEGYTFEDNYYASEPGNVTIRLIAK